MPKQSTWALSIGSALGGAALLFAGQVAIEEYKSYRQGIADARDVELARANERKSLIQDMVDQFGELGRVASRAGKFVESGRGGSKNDVDQIASHFRVLSRHIANGRIEASEAAPNYGGPIIYWSKGFRQLEDQTSPAAQQFTREELVGFGLLADALDQLSAEIALPRKDPFSAVANHPVPKARPGGR